MSVDQKMQQVEAETIALMGYLDSRNLRADVGVSALISALTSVSAILDLPVDAITDAMRQARTIRDELFSSEGKSLH
jgi:hypothetical protein